MQELVSFNYHRIKFRLAHPQKTSKWLVEVATNQKKNIIELNYIFCSDQHLLKINKQFLNHDYFTDIITFDYKDDVNLNASKKNISGDIYVSIDRVKENSKTLNIEFEQELDRVIVHGLLHLCGYADKKPEDEANMRKLEEKYLGFDY